MSSSSPCHRPGPRIPPFWAMLLVVITLLIMPACGGAPPRAGDAAMSGVLSGKRIAILVDDGFEQSELTEPRRALDEAGARTVLVAPRAGMVRGWSDGEWGERVPVDLQLNQAKAEGFDALLLPGGVMSPDRLRIDSHAVAFVHAFITARKPIAAICHGPWTLIDAGGVKGRTLTSWPSLRTDLVNAGAIWVDQEVFRDGNLVTSRKPADLPAFNLTMIQAFSGMVAGPAR